MNPLARKEYIRTIFPNLNETSLDTILGHADEVQCAKGTKLIRESQRHQYFYIIKEGSVKSYYQKEVCLWFAFENEIVSTIKTFEGQRSHETTELSEDSKFIQFKTEPIKELAQSDLPISHWIIELITEHAAFLEERRYGLQFMNSQERYNALIKAAPEIV